MSDILLGLSVIAAPVILGMLLFYGMTMSERIHHHDADTERKADEEAQKLFVSAEQDQRAKKKALRPSEGPLDLTSHRPGTSG